MSDRQQDQPCSPISTGNRPPIPTEYPPPIKDLSAGELVDILIAHAAGECSEGWVSQVTGLDRFQIRKLLYCASDRVDAIAARYRSELDGLAASDTTAPPK